MYSYLPTTIKLILRPLYHFAFRAQLRARCRLHDFKNKEYNHEKRIPPAILRYRVGESIDTAEFLRVGKGCAHIVETNLRNSGIDFSSRLKILDFGCGCGRVLRWLSMQAPLADFYGVDVDNEAIDWCRRNLKEAQFQKSRPTPPLPYPDNFFHVIYSVSVFTHLNEEMQDTWFEELRRILAESGTLIFTVHGAVEAQALASYERDRLFSDGFLCHNSRKLKGIVPDWYGVSWHTENYVMKRTSNWFSYAEYRNIPDSGQDVVLCRK